MSRYLLRSTASKRPSQGGPSRSLLSRRRRRGPSAQHLPATCRRAATKPNAVTAFHFHAKEQTTASLIATRPVIPSEVYVRGSNERGDLLSPPYWDKASFESQHAKDRRRQDRIARRPPCARSRWSKCRNCGGPRLWIFPARPSHSDLLQRPSICPRLNFGNKREVERGLEISATGLRCGGRA